MQQSEEADLIEIESGNQGKMSVYSICTEVNPRLILKRITT